MLRAEAPFPEPGSWCLVLDGDELLLARIMSQLLDADDTVIVSLPEREGSSGTRRLPRRELIEAGPLTPEEVAELARLGAMRRLDPTQAEREHALLGRIHLSHVLRDRLARLREREKTE